MRRLLLLLLLCICWKVNAQEAAFTLPRLQVLYDSACTCGPLQIVPVRRQPIGEATPEKTDNDSIVTLREAMRKGLVTFSERGAYMLDNIHALQLRYRGYHPLMIHAGEVLLGGRQDRVTARDTLLQPGAGPQTLPVFCIEEGRWSSREKPFAYGGTVSAGLQALLQYQPHQTLLWNEIRKLLHQQNSKSQTSYSFWQQNKRVADTLNRCVRFFQQRLTGTDSSYAGLLAVTGNRVLGADVLISESLFYQVLPQLLEKFMAAALQNGAPPQRNNMQIHAYAQQMLQPTTQEAFLRKKGKRLYFKGVLLQITGFE
ncbi:MAG: ARPP-1 family domain-containing protein [Lacibacter sp.]